MIKKLLRQMLNGTRNSIKGLRYVINSEYAFFLELLGTILAIPIALVLGQNEVERVLLIGSALLILIIELINSAIETTIDRISDTRHPLSGRAKDLSSAAVFLTIILAAIVWLMILM